MFTSRRTAVVAAAVLAACVTLLLAGPAPARQAHASAPAAFQDELVVLINQFRAEQGLRPLTASPVLALLGEEHSADMLARGYYDHDAPGGPTFEKRIGGFLESEGYVAWTAEENLDATTGDPDAHDVLHDWVGSPPHRMALMSRDTQTIGIGTAHVDVGVGVWEGDTDITAITAVFGPPQPVFGQSVLVTTVRGVVRIRRAGQKAFKLLRGTQLIRVGTEVDTEAGRVRLTSAADPLGHVQTADFYDGRFIITYLKPPELQPPQTVTNLALSRPLLCSASKKARRKRKHPGRLFAGEARNPPPNKSPTNRHLWGDGKGKFRTQGGYASATVAGTVWLTQDTCTGTLVRVQRGVVDVYDVRLRKHVILHAGESYTARKR